MTTIDIFNMSLMFVSLLLYNYCTLLVWHQKMRQDALAEEYSPLKSCAYIFSRLLLPLVIIGLGKML